jgi:hypothetical protein
MRSATWATIELLGRLPVSYQSDKTYECGNRLWFASAKRADCPSPRTIHCCRRKTTTANLKPISEFSWRGEFETSIHFADLAPYHHCRPVTDLLLILIEKIKTRTPCSILLGSSFLISSWLNLLTFLRVGLPDSTRGVSQTLRACFRWVSQTLRRRVSQTLA